MSRHVCQTSPALSAQIRHLFSCIGRTGIPQPTDEAVARTILSELSILALDDHDPEDVAIRWQLLLEAWPEWVDALATRAKGVL